MQQIDTIDLTADKFKISKGKATFTLWMKQHASLSRTIADWPDLVKRASIIAEGNCSTKDARNYGKELGDLLFPEKFPSKNQNDDNDTDYRRYLRAALDRLDRRVEGHRFIRIRLFFSAAPALWKIPWEYMLINFKGREATEADFLVLNPEISIVRCLYLEDDEPRSIPSQAKILGVFAKTKNRFRSDLDLENEREGIESALKSKPAVGAHLNNCAPPTLEKLQEKLRASRASNEIAIFHFAGHAGLRKSPSNGSGEIWLQGTSGGSVERVSADRLAMDMGGVRTAVINACAGSQNFSNKDWSSVAGSLVRKKANAVVAMQCNIVDKPAIAFSKGFYGDLVTNNSIDTAVWAGRMKMFDELAQFKKLQVRAFGTPTLWMHSEYIYDSAWLTGESSARPEPEPEPKRVSVDYDEAAKLAADSISPDAAEEDGRMVQPDDIPPVITGYEDKDEDLLLRVDDPRLFRAGQQFLLGDLMIVPVLANQVVPIKIYGQRTPHHTVHVHVDPNGNLTLTDWRDKPAAPLVVQPGGRDEPPVWPKKPWPRPPYMWQFKFYQPSERLMLTQRVTLAFDPTLVRSVWRIWHQCQTPGDPKRPLNFLVLSSHLD